MTATARHHCPAEDPEQASREKLRQAAAVCGVTVIDGALAGRDVETYVRQELEPRLSESSARRK